MALDMNQATLKNYLEQVRRDQRKIRVTLIALDATCFGAPVHVGDDYAIFPATEGKATRIVPYSAILYVENVT